MPNKYIVFQDGELKGYLDDIDTAKRAVSDLAKHLVAGLKQSSSTRIFSEELDNGVKIYSQITGTFLNGSVILQHFLEYKEIPFFVMN